MNIFCILALVSLGIVIIALILSLCFLENEKILSITVSILLGGLLLSSIFAGIFAWIMQTYLCLIISLLFCICFFFLIISFIKAVVL